MEGMFHSVVLCMVESFHVLEEICFLQRHRACDAEDFGQFTQCEQSVMVLLLFCGRNLYTHHANMFNIGLKKGII